MKHFSHILYKFFVYYAIFFTSEKINAEEFNVTLHEKCIYPSIRIEILALNGIVFGSGTIVKSEPIQNDMYINTVITCNHIFENTNFGPFLSEGGTRVAVFNYNKSELCKIDYFYSIEKYYINKDKDISIILFISDKKLNSCLINLDQQYFIGNKIISVGSSMGEEPRLAEGIISSVGLLDNNRKGLIRSSVGLIQGDSGCGLFVDNQLVGIGLSFRKGTNPPDSLRDISYALPVKILKNLDEKPPITFLYNTEDKTPELYINLLKLRNYKIK